MSLRTVLTAVAVGAVLSACGTETSPPTADESPSDAPAPASRPTAIPAADGPVTTLYPVTVLDDGDGAELCVGGVAESLPPQCGGPVLVGWDWAEHEGDFERASGVRWGDFAVTGTFDGTSLTPTEVVSADEFEPPAGLEGEEEPDRGTPCPVPEGGWRVLDPEKTTDGTMNATFLAAEKLDGYAEAWMDQSINPVSEEELTPDNVDQMNDPTKLIINVRVTREPEAAEARLREIWGGALCVSEALRTRDELMEIQTEVNELPGMNYSAPGDDVVELGVTYDDGSIQDWVDATYGEGVVVVYSSLRDVEDVD